MKLTPKDEKLLNMLEKNWKYRNLTYMFFGLFAVKNIIYIIKAIISGDDCVLVLEYNQLLMILVVSAVFFQFLRLYKIVKKLYSEYK